MHPAGDVAPATPAWPVAPGTPGTRTVSAPAPLPRVPKFEEPAGSAADEERASERQQPEPRAPRPRAEDGFDFGSNPTGRAEDDFDFVLPGRGSKRGAPSGPPPRHLLDAKARRKSIMLEAKAEGGHGDGDAADVDALFEPEPFAVLLAVPVPDAFGVGGGTRSSLASP
mmetsp:Transcript_147065/g.472281  ORF Transcript_147065/g.472281 Transcript_147065/m.472281 type:complete len:169 (-) Transcript_147065:62-568(-)